MIKLIRKLLFLDAHICPAWASFSLDNALRKLVHNPESILSGFIRKGDTVLDAGCGPGYFTVAMAKMAGEEGRVIAADIQGRMLERLRRRAQRHGVLSRIKFYQCAPDDLGVSEEADFVLAFWMAHEVPDPRRFFLQIASVLKPGTRMLLAEPKGHVTAVHFNAIVEAAAAAGLQPRGHAGVRFSRAMVFSLREAASAENTIRL